MIRLPILVKRKRHIWSYVLMWGPYILLYQLTNRYHLFTPQMFKLSGFDKWIPFISWTIPIYVSYLAFVFIVISRSEDNSTLNRIFYLSHIQLFISLLFFVFYPVTFPRDQFYVSGNVASVFNKFWLWFDAPNNCFPSLHAANSLLCAWMERKRKYGRFYILWGGMIVLSTMTSKQHYVVDILAGTLLFLFTVLLNKYIRFAKRDIPALEEL